MIFAINQVGYNWFERNNEHAVRIVPLLSAVGRIANNTFVNHSRYVLLLDNGDDLLDERYYQSALVRYQVRYDNISSHAGVVCTASILLLFFSV